MHTTHKVGSNEKKNQIILFAVSFFQRNVSFEHKFFIVSIAKMQIELAVFKFEFF